MANQELKEIDKLIAINDLQQLSPASTTAVNVSIPSGEDFSENRAQNLANIVGSISAQPDYVVPPKGSFKGMTKEESDVILDMVTGSSSALKLLRPIVGRVVTNLVRPTSYSAKQKLDIIKKAYKEKGAKGLLDSIIKDKPIYTDDIVYGNLIPKGKSLQDARDVPYRMMFDLKPRQGKPAYSNVDKLINRDKGGSFDIVNEISFNPNTVMGNKQLRNIVEEVVSPVDFSRRNHITLGDFLSKKQKNLSTGKVEGLTYEDVWDLGFNKGELGKILKQFKKADKSEKKDIIASTLLRSLVGSITNPVTIKGTVPKNIYDDVINTLTSKAK